MATPESRWDRFGTSIFTVMSQMANAHGAINLAQGFPDNDGPDEIKAAAISAMQTGHNQYAPSAGLPELRKLLAMRQAQNTSLTWNPESEVTVFSGATEAMFVALLALGQPGREVLALAPFYDGYPAAAEAANLKFRSVPLANERGLWRLDREALRQAISTETQILLVNTPHNPTGAVLDADDMALVAELARHHDLLVITDEVYEELVFAPAQHLSLAALPGMADRTVTISSTSKTFSMTGWKIGYAFAKPELTRALRAVHQFTVFCSATPLQYGMIAALQLADSYYEEFRADHLRRRDLLLNELQAAGFECAAPAGTYFILADYSQLSALPDREFCEHLTRHIGVAAIPISVFFDDPDAAARDHKVVRFAFCKQDDVLKEAGQRLARLRS